MKVQIRRVVNPRRWSGSPTHTAWGRGQLRARKDVVRPLVGGTERENVQLEVLRETGCEQYYSVWLRRARSQRCMHDGEETKEVPQGD